MKRILLLEDGRPFWPRVRELLGKVNAAVDAAPLGDLPAAGRGGPPDLVVVGDVGYDALPPALRAGALLVLEKGRDPDSVVPLSPSGRQVAASSSIDGRTLLALTSRLLAISERRLFRAVIGIKRPDDPHLYMGASREFSLTGLSFTLGTPLRQGERPFVSFHIPGAGRRVSLETEVVRSFADPDDGSPCYGARFTCLRDEERDLLKRFVWAES